MNEDEIDDMEDIAAHLLGRAEECSRDTRLLVIGNDQARDLAKLCHWVLMILDGIEQESAECGESQDTKESKP